MYKSPLPAPYGAGFASPAQESAVLHAPPPAPSPKATVLSFMHHGYCVLPLDAEVQRSAPGAAAGAAVP